MDRPSAQPFATSIKDSSPTIALLETKMVKELNYFQFIVDKVTSSNFEPLKTSVRM